MMDKHSIEKNIRENNWDYLIIANLEGVGIEKITDINTRYKNLNAVAGKQLKIPLISHHIWLTRQDSPKEIREQDLKVLIKVLTILDGNNSDWLHILWTNCKACIPQSLGKLKHQNLIVAEIHDIKDSLISYNIVLNLIEKKQFGIAADFLRFNILNEWGGFYCDLNYMLNYNPEQDMKTYELFTHTARGGVFVDVYMIATKPHHPILEETLNTVLKNFIDPPYHIQLAQNSSMHIKQFTGLMTFLPFNLAFFNNVNQETIDFAFPLEIKGGYPNEAKQVYGINHYEEADCCRPEDKAIEMYYKKEICKETILGFDSWDGDTWV